MMEDWRLYYDPDCAQDACLNGIAWVLGLERLGDETDVQLRERIKRLRSAMLAIKKKALKDL